MSETDFLLLMCHCEDRAKSGIDNNWYILSTADRERLREVGIQTAHEQPAWARVEPAQGQYDWGYLDNIVNRNRNAGLKSLVQLPGWRLPDWIPNEWRAQQKNGAYEVEVLSLWNEEAQTYSSDYIKVVMDHYKDQKDVGFFFGEFQGGEAPLPCSHCYFDHCALDNYKEIFGNDAVPDLSTEDTQDWFHTSIITHYIQKGEVFYLHNKEIWNCQQRLMDRWNIAFGNHVQPEIMRLYREIFTDASLVLLQYTYFDGSHTQDERDWVDNIIKISQCETIVEAMYCAGLPTTTPKAIEKGFRGQIVQPAHNVSNQFLDQTEVDIIGNSYNLWKADYESRSNN